MIPISFQDKKIPAKMAIRVTGAFMGLIPLPDLYMPNLIIYFGIYSDDSDPSRFPKFNSAPGPPAAAAAGRRPSPGSAAPSADSDSHGAPGPLRVIGPVTAA